MGNNESLPNNNSIELDENNIYQTGNNIYYSKRYNLIPSYKNATYEIIDKNFFNSSEIEITDFVDLRKTFPSIINVHSLPFNPIACVSYLLEYSLLKNGLDVFPPSLMFIYKHCKFFKGIPELISFEAIFKSIRSKGFCIENEFRTNKVNLSNVNISDDLYEKASPYKFIKVLKVLNNLEIIKIVLSHKYPILVGLSIYNDLSKIHNKLLVPDHNTEKNLGGIGGVLVGYMEEREMFIMAQTYGTSFGQNGYILVPYNYILNNSYTFEMYVLDLNKKKIKGYLNQTNPIISLNETSDEQQSGGGFLSNLFS